MNIFFLGAGFSKPAGLPLGNQLFQEILDAAKAKGLYEGNLEYSIREYQAYYHTTAGEEIVEDKINIEGFMSYLDISRLLQLEGGDYTAPEEIFKNLIAYVLHQYQNKISEDQYVLYEKFAEQMSLDDIVFTFNYDTVLEEALERVNKPYRYYQFRYKYDEKANTLIIDPKQEVTIYKMHGSIHWFDKSNYQDWKDDWLARGYDKEPPFIVFDGSMKGDVHRLLHEPFRETDALKNLYIVEDLDRYFMNYFGMKNRLVSDSPFIIAPSHHKLASLDYLSEFWYRFPSVIIGANKIIIIGFSLPEHDNYIRQPMYWYINNFRNYSGIEMKGGQ